MIEAAIWVAVVYLAVGLVWAGVVALYAWASGDSLSLVGYCRHAATWPATLWRLVGPGRRG